MTASSPTIIRDRVTKSRSPPCSPTNLVLIPQNVIDGELRDPDLSRRELRAEDGAGVAHVGHEQLLVHDHGGGGRAADFRLHGVGDCVTVSALPTLAKK